MANGHGGKREGAGRKPGARNKKTQEAIDAAQASGVMPLDLMLQYMREAHENNDRETAAALAKDAAPYLHPKLSSTSVDSEMTINPLSDLWQAIANKSHVGQKDD